MKNIVLDSDDISNKIKRLSYEIIEKNIEEKEIFIFGILPNGKYLSEKIKSNFIDNSDIKINIFYVEIDKEKSIINKINPKIDRRKLNGKVFILVDDVMNSGTTLMYTINKLLEYNPKFIQVAVLIERYYKNFPITPDFKGLELSTSKSEHVEVTLKKSPKVLIK